MSDITSGIRINALDGINSATASDNDYLPLDTATGTKKITFKEFKKKVLGKTIPDKAVFSDNILKFYHTKETGETSDTFLFQVDLPSISSGGGSGQDGVGISNIAKTGTSGLVDTYTITLTDNSTYTFTVTNGKDGASASTPTLKKLTINGVEYDGTEEVNITIDSSGASIAVDNTLSSTSLNPISNKAVTEEFNNVRQEIPSNTSDLNNDSGFLTSIPVSTSTVIGGVKADAKDSNDTVPVRIGSDGKLYVKTYPTGSGAVVVDSELSSTSENPVQNKVIYDALTHKAGTEDLPSIATETESGLVYPHSSYFMVGTDGKLSPKILEELNDDTTSIKFATSKAIVDYVKSKVSSHNTSTDAHNDIRELVKGLTSRLNALADSDDETLDRMSEIVSYIKYNRSMINGIDTNKVDVSDIVNNLTSNNTNKPLSAKQGRVLKTLIDAITIPEKLPNPNALSIAVNGTTKTYDGSEVVTIDIPSGSADNNRDTNHYYVTPEQFGAVGDGTNDDTNAINQSLASGKPVYFSAKTYKVSSSLTLQTGTRMYGNGAKIFFVPKTELYFGLHLLNISDVLIKDFYFDSERTQTGWAPAGHTRNDLSTSLVDCICIQNSKDIIIENCNFNNMESDFWMQNATAGYLSGNIIIRNWYSRNSSMPLFANNSTNVIIENANVEPANIGGDGDHIIYISDGCNHWKINDFTFTAPDDTYGALCTVHGSTEYEGNVIIDNCKFVGKDKVLFYSYVTGEIKIRNSILETTESLIGGSFFGNYIIENSDITCGNLSATSNDSENGNYKIGIKINNCNLECLWEVLAITNGTFIFSNSNIKFSTFFINCRANGKKANVEINRCTIEKTGTTVYFIAVRSSKYAFKITHTTFISNTSNTQLMYIAGSDITSLSEYILCGVIVLSTVSNSSISMFSGYSGTLDAKMSGCFYGQE